LTAKPVPYSCSKHIFKEISIISLRINAPAATSREIFAAKPATNGLLTIKRNNNCDHYSKMPFCSHANHCSNANSGIIPIYMDLTTERPLLPCN